MDYQQKLLHHFKPKKGWINDPNGLVYYKGMYHVFYQHCTDFEIPWQQPMHWGHAVTKDFIEWEELPVALTPDLEYDKDGCWSGTAVVKDNVLYLIYASVIDNGENHPKWIQTVSVAYSEDGIHFKKYENNPVIAHSPADGSVENFRDPAVICINDVYYCVMATGHEESNSARLLLYKSNDLFNWEYAGIMSEWENSLCSECPSIVSAGDKFLLAVSVIPKGKRHYFELIYGSFKDGKFQIEHSSQNYKGPDQYAGQVFKDYKGRNILISWLPGWDYSNFAKTDIGCMSAPCEITLKDGEIYVYPVEEIRHLLKDEDPAVKITKDGFVIEREGREPVKFNGKFHDLKILRDGYIVEVFVDGGKEVYAAVL